MRLVSVIIPTHDRARYAIPTIRSILAISPDIEVVVCDTSALDLISPEFINDLSLSRLKLVRPNRPMSVVDNFNAALDAATGDYLVFIGDDDFVSHSLISVALWAAKQEVDAVKFSFPVHYYWPDFKHATRNDEYAGTLHITEFTGNINPLNPRETIQEATHKFGGGVFEMPRAYAGMISNNLAKKICEKYGELFGGVSPDIYSAFLIALETERCVKVDYPVIIPGFSGASTAGQSANGKHIGGLRDNAHIGAFKQLEWDERIPEFYSIQTVWSFSLLKAIEKAKFDISEVNFTRLYTKCLIYQRTFTRITLISLKAYAKTESWWRIALGALAACIEESIWVAAKLQARLTERLIPSIRYIKLDITNTCVASNTLETYLKDSGINLKLDLRDIQ